MKQKILKNLVLNKRQMRRELSLLKSHPKEFNVMRENAAKSGAVVFAVDGDVLKIIGFKN